MRIKGVDSVPLTEPSESSGLSKRDQKTVDFGNIYQEHKARWSNNQPSSSNMVKAGQTEPTNSAEASVQQITHLRPAITSHSDHYSPKTEHRASPFPIERFTEPWTFGQFSPLKGPKISSGMPMQDRFHPKKNLSSSPWSLQSLASKPKKVVQHTLIDSWVPKKNSIYLVSSQTKASPYIYKTEDHTTETYEDSRMLGVQDARVSRGYGHSALMYLRPQTRPTDPKSSSIGYTISPATSAIKFDSSHLQSYPFSSTGRTSHDEPGANRFRSRQKSSGYLQYPGMMQPGGGSQSFRGTSYGIGFASQWRKTATDRGGSGNTGQNFKPVLQPRSSKLIMMGKFKPFQVSLMDKVEDPAQGR